MEDRERWLILYENFVREPTFRGSVDESSTPEEELLPLLVPAGGVRFPGRGYVGGRERSPLLLVDRGLNGVGHSRAPMDPRPFQGGQVEAPYIIAGSLRERVVHHESATKQIQATVHGEHPGVPSSTRRVQSRLHTFHSVDGRRVDGLAPVQVSPTLGRTIETPQISKGSYARANTRRERLSADDLGDDIT